MSEKFHVYVIGLKPEFAKTKAAKSQNTNFVAGPNKRYYYVGYTSDTHEIRYEKHITGYVNKKGHRISSPKVYNYVRNISNLLNDNYEAFDMFSSFLYEYGYNPLDEDDYESFDFQEILVYKVNDNFPKLIPSMIVNSLSERISKVNYRVDLDGLKSKKIDQLKFGDYCF